MRIQLCRIIKGENCSLIKTIEELHKRTNSSRMEFRIKMRRLRMLSKIERMPDDMITKVLMYGAINVEQIESFNSTSTLRLEKTKKRKQNPFMIQTKAILEEFDINVNEWRKLVLEPQMWRRILKTKENELNQKWRRTQIKERDERKTKSEGAETSSENF